VRNSDTVQKVSENIYPVILVIISPFRGGQAWARRAHTSTAHKVYPLTPMDCVTLPHAQSTIALYTELDTECDH